MKQKPIKFQFRGRKFVYVVGQNYIGVAEVVSSRPSIEEIERHMQSFAFAVPQGIDLRFAVQLEIVKRIGPRGKRQTIKPPLSVRLVDGSH